MKTHAQRDKKFSRPLLLSLIFHIVFAAIWWTLQIQLQKKEDEPYIQIEIVTQSRKPAPRVVKRPLTFPLVSNSPKPQSQPIAAENPTLRPSPAQIRPVTQTRLPMEIPLSMLTEDSIPLSVASDSANGTSLLSPTRQISRGQIGTRNNLSGGQVGLTRQSLGMEVQTALPEISGWTQPDIALIKVARHLLSTRKGNMIDIVFIIDASQSMQNDIDAVRNHLTEMTNLFEAHKLDFTVGAVAFRSGTTFSLLGWDFQITPQTTSVQRIKETLENISCRGGEKASDALVQAADEVKFRNGAQRRFILVTDEYISGSYSATAVLEKMRVAQVGVNIIGRDENFQKMLAEGSGGLWLPIASLKE